MDNSGHTLDRNSKVWSCPTHSKLNITIIVTCKCDSQASSSPADRYVSHFKNFTYEHENQCGFFLYPITKIIFQLWLIYSQRDTLVSRTAPESLSRALNTSDVQIMLFFQFNGSHYMVNNNYNLRIMMNIKVYMLWLYVYELLKTWMFSNKKIHNVTVQKRRHTYSSFTIVTIFFYSIFISMFIQFDEVRSNQL